MRTGLILLVCLAMSGCVSTQVQRTDELERAPRSPEDVQVLFERPQVAYKVIAVLDAESRTVFDSYDDLQKDMVREAAELGGDGLILGRKSERSEFILSGVAMIKSDFKKMAGAVIVFQDVG